MKFNQIKVILIIFSIFISQYSYGVPIMHTSEVKPGMIGTAYTVFEGMKQESFKVKILSVIDNTQGPQSQMILAQLIGKHIEQTGLAEGMSGSPVYINGKLIGAMAFAWSYSKESVGGIQPIDQMLPVLKESKSKHPPLKSRSSFKLRPKPKPIPLQKEASAKNPSSLKPMSVPIYVSGFSDASLDYISESMAKKGIRIMKNGGGGKVSKNNKKAKNESLKPGDAVGILFMNGDGTAGAIGTVTYLDKKDPTKLLMFGHPLNTLGYTTLPMTKAFIHHTMASYNISWKMGTTTDIVGEIYNDRTTAVAGKIGIKPAMTPVSVKVINDDEKDTQNFHYNIVKNPNFFPDYFSLAIFSGYNRYNSNQNQTVHLNADIAIKNLTDNSIHHLVIQDYIIGKGPDAIKGIATYIKEATSRIYFNFYDDIDIVNAKVTLNYKNNIQAASIVRAITPQNFVRPGDTAHIKVVVNTYKNKKEVIPIDVPVPYNYKEAFLPISIAGGNEAEGNYNTSYEGVKDPYSFLQLLKIFAINNRSQQLVAFYDTKGITANINGYELKNLPLSKAMDYGIKEQGNKYYNSSRHKFSFLSNYLITGHVQVFIPVKKV